MESSRAQEGWAEACQSKMPCSTQRAARENQGWDGTRRRQGPYIFLLVEVRDPTGQCGTQALTQMFLFLVELVNERAHTMSHI